eukprot:scaffold28459_cov32-Attheya_sp.AAC.2
MRRAAAAHNGICEPTHPARTPITRQYSLVRIKRAAISCSIIDELHAHYQKQTEKDIKYPPRNTTTSTKITTGPTRYDEARLAKSEDNNKTYDATL